jgi:excisionase family DNA binding protein
MENNPQQPTPAQPDDSTRWLTLKEASDFLGIHFTTLRSWADSGEVRVFRTPGGHRRFSLDDLRRFLDARSAQVSAPNVAVVMDAALVRVRTELDRSPRNQTPWREGFHDDSDDVRRQRGRQLFALALAYVLKPGQRERIVDDGRQLGRAYGREAAQHRVSLAETGRAVQFFRGQLLLAVRHQDGAESLDADDVRVQRLIDQFLDEVLFAVLDGYESVTSAVISP